MSLQQYKHGATTEMDSGAECPTSLSATAAPTADGHLAAAGDPGLSYSATTAGATGCDPTATPTGVPLPARHMNTEPEDDLEVFLETFE